MSDAPFHNLEQFEKAIERLIEQADAQNRGADLDRLVSHLQRSPADVSRLASLLMMVDDDFRSPLKADVDAFRRFHRQKKREASDDEILKVMMKVYATKRG